MNNTFYINSAQDEDFSHVSRASIIEGNLEISRADVRLDKLQEVTGKIILNGGKLVAKNLRRAKEICVYHGEVELGVMQEVESVRVEGIQGKIVAQSIGKFRGVIVVRGTLIETGTEVKTNNDLKYPYSSSIVVDRGGKVHLNNLVNFTRENNESVPEIVVLPGSTLELPSLEVFTGNIYVDSAKLYTPKLQRINRGQGKWSERTGNLVVIGIDSQLIVDALRSVDGVLKIGDSNEFLRRVDAPSLESVGELRTSRFARYINIGKFSSPGTNVDGISGGKIVEADRGIDERGEREI